MILADQNDNVFDRRARRVMFLALAPTTLTMIAVVCVDQTGS
jgi:hypothetical protein